MSQGDSIERVSGAIHWTTGQLAALACTWEVCAPKPGNVHRGADFDDLTVGDFLISSLALVPIFDQAAQLSVGQLVLRGVSATRAVVQGNSNLGIVLLLAPLAKAALQLTGPLTQTVEGVLRDLTEQDSRDVYEAIRIARPGGMDQATEMDVRDEAPAELLKAMQLAASRDRVARQYCESFTDVLTSIEPGLVAHLEQGMTWSQAIVYEHVRCLARWPDSLIVRKCGPETGAQCQHMAQAVLRAGVPGEESYHAALADFDFWLRSDGRRRNPGTTADLICAALFAGLLQGHLVPSPWR